MTRCLVSYSYKMDDRSPLGVGYAVNDYTDQQIDDPGMIASDLLKAHPGWTGIVITNIVPLGWIATPVNVKPDTNRLKEAVASVIWAVSAVCVLSIGLLMAVFYVAGARIDSEVTRLGFTSACVFAIVAQSALVCRNLYDIEATEHEAKRK